VLAEEQQVLGQLLEALVELIPVTVAVTEAMAGMQ
jgi:hypothetical protein